ncbi:MAG: hypothetical protein RL417_1913 [Pseudomonadota bacterium]|jgi:hypothetical protein
MNGISKPPPNLKCALILVRPNSLLIQLTWSLEVFL